MLDRLLYLFGFDTVRYAFAALVLISLCASLLGVSLVLKRFSMIGDGLSHVTFGVSAVASVLGLVAPIYLTLPLTVLAAILLLKVRSGASSRGDAAIAMMSAASLAFGYLLLDLFGKTASDACVTLFGPGILAIDKTDVMICSILALIVLAVFILFYNRIFAVTFDESFAAATGTKVGAYETVSAITVGVMTVVAMELVGALLVSALIIFPALSAMRVFKTFKKVTICAAIISIICSVAGTLISIALSTPVGPTIVIADIIAFAIFFTVGKAKQK